MARQPVTAELAFAVLVERHGPMVQRVCRGVLRNEHAVDDAFQSTFLVLVAKASSLRVRTTLAPWLHAVAYRVACEARSTAARREARAPHRPPGSCARLKPSSAILEKSSYVISRMRSRD